MSSSLGTKPGSWARLARARALWLKETECCSATPVSGRHTGQSEGPTGFTWGQRPCGHVVSKANGSHTGEGGAKEGCPAQRETTHNCGEGRAFLRLVCGSQA